MHKTIGKIKENQKIKKGFNMEKFPFPSFTSVL